MDGVVGFANSLYQTGKSVLSMAAFAMGGPVGAGVATYLDNLLPANQLFGNPNTTYYDFGNVAQRVFGGGEQQMRPR